MKIAIIGGTGKLGLAFVTRLQITSHDCAVGSRDVSKAEAAVSSIQSRATAMSNSEAAAWCDAAILTIPYSGHRAVLEPLKAGLGGKIVIDATVPLNPQNLFQLATESGTSAAEETNVLLGTAHVFAGFHTISHRILRKTDHVEDVLVAGPAERKTEVLQLIREMSLHPIDAGPIEAARLLENMTALLISINKQNKVKESGFKVTGVP